MPIRSFYPGLWNNSRTILRDARGFGGTLGLAAANVSARWHLADRLADRRLPTSFEVPSIWRRGDASRRGKRRIPLRSKAGSRWRPGVRCCARRPPYVSAAGQDRTTPKSASDEGSGTSIDVTPAMAALRGTPAVRGRHLERGDLIKPAERAVLRKLPCCLVTPALARNDGGHHSTTASNSTRFDISSGTVI